MRTPPPFSATFKKLHPWFGEASLIHFALIEGRQRRQFLLCHTGFPRISATWQATTTTSSCLPPFPATRGSPPPPALVQQPRNHQIAAVLLLPDSAPASSSCSRWICRPISATRTNGKKCGQFKRAAARRIYHENPIKSGQRSVWVGEGAWQRWQRERGRCRSLGRLMLRILSIVYLVRLILKPIRADFRFKIKTASIFLVFPAQSPLHGLPRVRAMSPSKYRPVDVDGRPQEHNKPICRYPHSTQSCVYHPPLRLQILLHL